jgi:hypothetical protein
MAVTFAGYCDSIEAVEIKSPHNNQSRTTPDLRPTPFQADVADINSVTGLKLSPEEIANLLKRMGYTATSSKTDSNILDVSVPVTRPDVCSSFYLCRVSLLIALQVLHQADIREDVRTPWKSLISCQLIQSTTPGRDRLWLQQTTPRLHIYRSWCRCTAFHEQACGHRPLGGLCEWVAGSNAVDVHKDPCTFGTIC